MIACRTLDSVLGAIQAELDAPQRDGQDVFCRFRIFGPVTRKEGRVFGVDGFQALTLALEQIGVDLRFSDECAAGPIRWLDMQEPGFPLSPCIADLGWDRARDDGPGSAAG